MKFKTAKFQQQFHWWLMVAVLAAAGCNEKKKVEEPKGTDTTAMAIQQAVTLVPCNDCCSLDIGAQPTIAIVKATPGSNGLDIEVDVNGITHITCHRRVAKQGAGHYLAVIVDDNPMRSKEVSTTGGLKKISIPLPPDNSKHIVRAYLKFTDDGVSMKHDNAVREKCMTFPGAAPCQPSDTLQPIAWINLPQTAPAVYQAGQPIVFDFLTKNVTLGQNGYSLKVTISGGALTTPFVATVTVYQPYKIMNVASSSTPYQITAELMENTTLKSTSSRTFTVQ